MRYYFCWGHTSRLVILFISLWLARMFLWKVRHVLRKNFCSRFVLFSRSRKFKIFGFSLCLHSFRWLSLLKIEPLNFSSAVMNNSTRWLDLPQEETFTDNGTRQLNEKTSQYVRLMNMSNNIMVYGGMVIIPIGIVLNLLTVITFLKIKIQKSTAGLHLLCLAISEFILLLASAVYWPWPYRIKYLPVTYCIITNFIISSQQTWAGLLMVSMIVERYISVAFPLKVKSWNLKRISKVSISFLGICSLIMGGLSGARRSVNSNVVPNQCVNNPFFKELNVFSSIFTYTVVGFGLCPIITFIFTFLIAHQLFKQKNARNTILSTRQTNNKEFTITLMLFLVSCLFLVSKTFAIITWQMMQNFGRNSAYFQHASVAYFYARLLLLINHSMNSFVYVIFFHEFRKAFAAMLCFKYKTDQGQDTDMRRRQMSSFSEEIQTVSRQFPATRKTGSKQIEILIEAEQHVVQMNKLYYVSLTICKLFDIWTMSSCLFWGKSDKDILSRLTWQRGLNLTLPAIAAFFSFVTCQVHTRTAHFVVALFTENFVRDVSVRGERHAHIARHCSREHFVTFWLPNVQQSIGYLTTSQCSDELMTRSKFPVSATNNMRNFSLAQFHTLAWVCAHFWHFFGHCSPNKGLMDHLNHTEVSLSSGNSPTQSRMRRNQESGLWLQLTDQRLVHSKSSLHVMEAAAQPATSESSHRLLGHSHKNITHFHLLLIVEMLGNFVKLKCP